MVGSNERSSLDLADANGVWSLWTFADFECNGITVGDFSGNFGDVHEEIVAMFTSQCIKYLRKMDGVTGKTAEFRPSRLGRTACSGAFSHEVGKQRRNEGCPKHYVVPKRQLRCFIVNIQPMVRSARFEVMRWVKREFKKGPA